jgi:hypothetical protein
MMLGLVSAAVVPTDIKGGLGDATASGNTRSLPDPPRFEERF